MFASAIQQSKELAQRLWEHVEEAGEDLAQVAEAFDLDVHDVRWALAYETSARAA
jgi:hypothetical protein